MKRAMWGVAELFAPLCVFAAGKSALYDHDPWTVWVPLLAISALVFVALAVRNRSTRQTSPPDSSLT